MKDKGTPHNRDTKSKVRTFQSERLRLNDLVMKYAGLETKRFWSLDGQVYRDGALPGRVKELLGLVASLVLRCDDCVRYHLGQCKEMGWEDAEIEEALCVGLIVGGSIVIPHLRRAFEYWEELGKG
ncbi:MAG: carboxymuconolactone decarboxylase family protein [Calditrichaeota bacterium]|nr:carboxymuconolactone decarboxylase family protein [Calditrichota bacterium]